MKANLVDHDDDGIGIRLYDERESEHTVEVDWDGNVVFHGNDDYPHSPEERTEEEQRIMSQVEERARYEAQKQFPDADILDPMWDPEHIERGLEAMTNYPIEEFKDTFWDFYAAVDDPSPLVSDPEMDPETAMANKLVRFRDGAVVDTSDVSVDYERHDGQSNSVGSVPDYPDDERLVLSLPVMDFADDFSFPEDFYDIVIAHLMAQIRDIYLNMGEDPPAEYRVEGIGKLRIVGDGY